MHDKCNANKYTEVAILVTTLHANFVNWYQWWHPTQGFAYLRGL